MGIHRIPAEIIIVSGRENICFQPRKHLFPTRKIIVSARKQKKVRLSECGNISFGCSFITVSQRVLFPQNYCFLRKTTNKSAKNCQMKHKSGITKMNGKPTKNHTRQTLQVSYQSAVHRLQVLTMLDLYLIPFLLALNTIWQGDGNLTIRFQAADNDTYCQGFDRHSRHVSD